MKLENTINTGYKPQAVLLDRVLNEIRQTLLAKLPWLNYAFGRAYKMVSSSNDGSKLVEPMFYNSKGEYLSLLPNDNFGNFCWFDIYDPQEISQDVIGHPTLAFRGAIVFWYNLKTITTDDEFLYTEDVKDQITKALSSAAVLKTLGNIKLFKIYENFENIYKNYTLSKVYNEYIYTGQDLQNYDKQFFMYPYAGLRIEFEISVKELC